MRFKFEPNSIMKRISLLLCLFISLKVYAQQHQVFQYPTTYYQRGVELYDEKKYNAAILQLELFLEKSTDEGMRSEAQYYLGMSKLFAGHRDGESSVQQFLEQNPGSHKTHMANFALGDYWYLKRKYSTALSYYKQVDPLAISSAEHDRLNYRTAYCMLFVSKNNTNKQEKYYKQAKELLYPLTIKENDYKVLATYYYAYCAYFVGDYDEALRAYKEIENSPEVPSGIKLYVAQIYYLKSDYQKCIATLNNAGEDLPREKVALLKGKCHYRLNEFEKAAEQFNKSNANTKDLDRNELYEFGYANYKLKNYKKAIDYFYPISSLGDSLGQVASYNIADCYLNTKDKRNAMKSLAEAYRTGYNKTISESALFNQAKLAVELKENNATTLLDKYLENYPNGKNSSEARKILAQQLLNTDNYKQAVIVLEGNENMDSETEDAYQKVTLYRGMELIRAYNYTEAIEMFNKCLEKKRNRNAMLQSLFWKAECEMQLRNYSNAERTYQRFLDDPRSEEIDIYPFAYYGLGYAKYKIEQDWEENNVGEDVRRNKYLEAATIFQKFVNYSNNKRYDDKILNDANCKMADCYFAAGANDWPYMQNHFESALKGYAAVSSKRGEFADYSLFHSGIIQGLQKKPDAKIATLKRIPAEFKNSKYVPDAYFEIADEYKSKKNTSEAEKYYNYIINDYQGSSLVIKSYISLGEMYHSNKQTSKAIDAYTKLYKQFPSSPEAAQAAEIVKRIYFEQNQQSEYFRWAERNGVRNSNGEKDTALYSAAIDQYNEEKYAAAIAKFDEYLNQLPNGRFMGYAYYYKGVCYEKIKQPDKALAAYKITAKEEGHEFQEASIMAVLDLMGNNAACEEVLEYAQRIESITKDPKTQRKSMVQNLNCLIKLNRWDDVIAKSKQMQDVAGAEESFYALAAVSKVKAHYEKGNLEQALTEAKECYGRYNNYFGAQAKYLEVLIYYKKLQHKECENAAFEMIDNFRAYDYWLGKALNVLGDSYLDNNDENNAKSTWNDVIENFPKEKEVVEEAKVKLAALKARKPRVNNLD